MIEKAVKDFPLPDSPTSATLVPVGIVNEISSTAGTAPSKDGTVTVRFSTLSTSLMKMISLNPAIIAIAHRSY
ncbi:unannotated protein [freshwater metagenome]|uniref:Unannotated protein n=1 Tax=freshwater metagenome TaxID=449393 RepID=A0A6J6LII1_9ZZZZ